jgi:hypothetical protein
MLLALVLACSGGTEPSGITVATIEVTPNSVSRQIGQTVQLGVALKNANGDLVSGPAVTWTSSNQAVASVSNSGLVTALALGATTISAMAGGKTGTAQVTVEGTPVANVIVLPETDTLLVGETVQLTAQLLDANGVVIPGRTPIWSTSAATVATVSENGQVTAISDGTATISASSGGVNDGAVITVFGPCSVGLAVPIELGATLNGSLESTDCQIMDGSFLDVYSITVPQTTDVQIDMSSTTFDTWLELYELVNPSTAQPRAVNDDIAEGNTDSRILFTLQGGAKYLVVANSFDTQVTGDYALSVLEVGASAGRPLSPLLKPGKHPGLAGLRLIGRR